MGKIPGMVGRRHGDQMIGDLDFSQIDPLEPPVYCPDGRRHKTSNVATSFLP